MNTQRHGRDASGAAAVDEYQESQVINITDEEVSFLVGTQPGSRPRRYTFSPFGKSGDRVSMPTGYAKPYKGAGRQMCTPIVERLSMRHVYEASYTRNEKGEPVRIESPRLPMVVHIDEAVKARAAWLAALSRAPDRAARPPAPIAARSPDAPPPRAPTPDRFVGEEVAQDDIEPPHPDDVEDGEVVADGPPGADVETPLRQPRGARA